MTCVNCSSIIKKYALVFKIVVFLSSLLRIKHFQFNEKFTKFIDYEHCRWLKNETPNRLFELSRYQIHKTAASFELRVCVFFFHCSLFFYLGPVAYVHCCSTTSPSQCRSMNRSSIFRFVWIFHFVPLFFIVCMELLALAQMVVCRRWQKCSHDLMISMSHNRYGQTVKWMMPTIEVNTGLKWGGCCRGKGFSCHVQGALTNNLNHKSS